MPYLCADIGGTKTWMAIVKYEKKKMSIVREQKYVSHDFNSLEEIIDRFLGDGDEEVTAACFGIAGIILNQESNTTNLPWVVVGKKISKQFNIPDVFLINDLEANALGIEVLTNKDFQEINKGKEEKFGARALISPGTGLGAAQMFYSDGAYNTMPSEGGHVDWAPRNEFEIGLLKYLMEKYGHVSCERVLSGQGISNIYHYIVDTNKAKESPVIREEMRKDDPAKVISIRGMDGTCLACKMTIERFVSICGAITGNLAITTKATGGVYMGGGIPPKLVSELKKEAFFRAFSEKGRFQTFLTELPIKVIMEDKTALFGTANYCNKKEQKTK